jgi:hypothetical protein
MAFVSSDEDGLPAVFVVPAMVAAKRPARTGTWAEFVRFATTSPNSVPTNPSAYATSAGVTGKLRSA